MPKVSAYARDPSPKTLRLQALPALATPSYTSAPISQWGLAFSSTLHMGGFATSAEANYFFQWSTRLLSENEKAGLSIRIKDNLWQVGGMELTHPSDAAAYLVWFGDKAALVDAGSGRNHSQLRENINKCLGPNTQLEYLLLTHCHFDHSGGAPAIRDEYGCRIVAHELDAPYLESGDMRVTGANWHGGCIEPFVVDIKLQGEESTLIVGSGTVTAIHCPGHSPGSVVYTTYIEDMLVLFGQDVHGPIHSQLRSDEEQYLNSLAKLLDLQADLLLEGHFGPIEPKEEVRAFIEYWKSPLGVSHYAVLYAPDDWPSR